MLTFMPNALAELTVEQLKRAVDIKEQIDSLQNELDNLLSGAPRRRGPGRPPGRGRRMSAAARAAISAAQKKRWAAQRGGAAASAGNGRRRKRRMTAEWRAKLSEAARARWAKRKAQGKNSL